jgi:hypothetical protein
MKRSLFRCSGGMTSPWWSHRSDPMNALPAKAATFRNACRFLPLLAAIRIPASVLSARQMNHSIIGCGARMLI